MNAWLILASESMMFILPDCVKPLKKKLPSIKVVKTGKQVTLLFDEDIDFLLKATALSDEDLLSRAAQLLREEILALDTCTQSAFLNSQDNVTPYALSSFLHSLLYGSVSESPRKEHMGVVQTLGEQIIYNTVSRVRKVHSGKRHVQSRETPTPIYTAMKLHVETGSSSLINIFHKKGLCISYDRLRFISADIANQMISKWEDLGVVVPLDAVKGVFTVGAFDNVDHNPSSTTAQTSLHGTCISITQYISPDNQGSQISQVDLQLNSNQTRNIPPLPDFYKNVDTDVTQPANESVYVPDDIHSLPPSLPVENVVAASLPWLTNMRTLLQKESLVSADWICWAAYYAAQEIHSATSY